MFAVTGCCGTPGVSRGSLHIQGEEEKRKEDESGESVGEVGCGDTSICQGSLVIGF